MIHRYIFPLLVVLNTQAFSQINSFPINQSLIGPGSVTFDLDNDGSDDFTFDIIMLPIGSLAARVLPILPSSMLDNSTFGYPDALIYGDPVEGYFHSSTGVLGTFNNAGQFNGQGDKYLGIKISSLGQIHFGWIKLYCSLNNDTLILRSCGYNTMNGAPILAGQTSVSEIGEKDQPSANIHLYPNPFSTSAIIQTNGPFQQATICIINSLGQTVKKMEVIQGQTYTLHREDLPNGFYFLSMFQDEKEIARCRISIQ